MYDKRNKERGEYALGLEALCCITRPAEHGIYDHASTHTGTPPLLLWKD